MRGALLLTLAAAPLLAQSPDLELFEKKVRPVLATQCASCHGSKVKMGGLDLSSVAGLAKGVESGPVVIPGSPFESPLFQAVLYTGKVKMPPAGKLDEDQIAGLKAWIEMGAPLPEDAHAPKPPGGKKWDPAEGRKHWAFQPVNPQAPPNVKNEAWASSAVDRFILAKLEEEGLQPASPASKTALLRRVTYDLTGLPPTVEEIQSFMSDNSPGAFAKVVDRLLASPRYGERWGRHWLDVARYADSTGMDEDHTYPHAWRYRDYVVNAFNKDLPFDRFVKEQIAGDILAEQSGGSNLDALVATGFLALGPKPLAQQDRVKAVYDIVDEQIDTVSKAFLGLTVACARCHDHKFDPILTKDYYALAGIFASTTSFRNLGRAGSVSYIHYAPLDPGAHGIYQAHRWRMFGKQIEMEEASAEDLRRENGLLRPKLASYLIAAWNVERKGVAIGAAAAEHDLDMARLRKWTEWLRAADEEARDGYLKKWVEATSETIAETAREYQEAYSNKGEQWDQRLDRWLQRFAREAAQDRDVPARPKFDAAEDPFFAAVTFDGGPMQLEDSPRVALLRREFETLEKTLPEEPPMASAVCEGVPVEQHVFLRGDHLNPGEVVPKQFPIVLAGESQKPVEEGSGRLQLADWLANPENPLTSRVMVNRIWQWHFGEGLVRTPNNWGTTGEAPTHPELLDYLAAKFVESGWSVKAMHRLILLSNTYQMSSRASHEAQEADPGNRLWSRFQRTRMSIEQIRDSFLALGGGLDPTIGGSLMPSGKGKKRVDPDDVMRRTLYIPVRRGSIPAVLATFDYGDATTASEGRPRTNVAPQALFIRNSRFVVDQAKGFAQRLLEDATLSGAQRVERAYWMALARGPEPREVDEALTYVASLQQRLNNEHAKITAWQSFCHVLMSTNEFLYLD